MLYNTFFCIFFIFINNIINIFNIQGEENMNLIRNIDHPGVDIREIDVSQYTPTQAGTYCLVAGYADEGQEMEPILNTSLEGFETIYGKPTNEAERYFYHTCKEVIQTGGSLVSVKLPYKNIISKNYKYMGVTVGGAEEIHDAPLSANGTPYETQMVHSFYTHYVPVTQSGIENMPVTAYDILAAGGGFDEVDRADPSLHISDYTFIIVDESKTGITGPENTQGLIVTFVDPIDAINAQHMLSGNMYEDDMMVDSYLSGTIDQARVIEGIRLPAGEAPLQWGTDIIPIDKLSQQLSGNISYQSSVSEDMMNQFPTIEQADDGDNIDKYYSHFIGVIVSHTFVDPYDPAKTTIGIAEAFVGSIHADKRNDATGQTEYIVDIVNASSQFIRMYGNTCVQENCSILNLPDDDGNSVLYVDYGIDNTTYEENERIADLIGFNSDERAKLIDGNTIPDTLNTAYEKLSNIDEIPIDVVVDAGLSTIAQFTVGYPQEYDPILDVDPENTTIRSSSDLYMWREICSIMIEFCSKIRKDCMAILDVPRHLVLQGDKKYIRKTAPDNTFANTIGKKLKYVTGLNSSYAALYMNWERMVDRSTGLNFWSPQTTKMAGIYTGTDRNYNVWDAPAGLTRGIIHGVNDIAVNPNGKAADQIYRKSINYSKKYPLDGFIAEGQKTTQTKPSAFDRVNVRRLFLRLERITRAVAKYFVYEPNNLFTRRRLIDMLDPIFSSTKAQGGLYDYEIVCDERNNTPEVIDNNELKVAILLKPVKTVEYILIDFIATRTGADFNEVIDQVVKL